MNEDNALKDDIHNAIADEKRTFGGNGQDRLEPVIRTGSYLDSTEFPEPKYSVPGIIPEGLTILSGKPKAGKSFVGLSCLLAVASGGYALGCIPVEQGTVLYLALEDTERRLKDRAKKQMAGKPLPDDFHYCVRDWGRGTEAAARIEKFILEHKDTRLVIVDTLQKIRAPSKKGMNSYEQDYEAISALKSIADKYHIAIVVIHHVRKATSEDIYDTLSGTLGLTGSADTIIILRREVNNKMDATLFIKGRDIEEAEKALKFDTDLCLWRLIGDAEEYRKSIERQQIINILKKAVAPMGPSEIAEMIDKPRNTVKRLLWTMHNEDEIGLAGRGKYIYKKQSIIEGEI